jgi:predicted DNA-binding antitoxin AbrB/MazE fold protein
MSTIHAIFRRGVFEPVDRVDLRENQRVRLSIDPAMGSDAGDWLNEVRVLQAGVLDRQPTLPDSAVDIAADRTR